MRRGRWGRWGLERWVTLALIAALAGVLWWRFGPQGPPEPPEGMPEDPFMIVAAWAERAGRGDRTAILPRAQIAVRAERNRLFETIEALPGTPMGERGYRVFRVGDEQEVMAEDQAAAVAGGNRCIFALGRAFIATQGGPLTAVVTLRAEMQLSRACAIRPAPAGGAAE